MAATKHETHPADQHASAPPAHDPPAATHDPAAPAAPAATPPAPPPYVVPKTLAGQKAKLFLDIMHTAGGDVKFVVVQVVNALDPTPGTYLTLDQVNAIGAAGWEITATAREKVV